MKEKCKNCMKPSKACIAYLMTLNTHEMLEWCRMWKDKLGWSNAYLAEKSKVPKGTIDRILSYAFLEGNATGVKLDTIRPVICALTGCTIEELESCEVTHGMETAVLIERNKYLEDDVERLKREAANQRTFLVDQIQKKDRYIAALAIALGICLAAIIAALIMDSLNPNWGLFWR